MENWDLKKNLAVIRDRFPVLRTCVYLISNSLGAVPIQVAEDLQSFFRLWAERGVGAWQDRWWDLSSCIGRELASFLGADEDEVTMMSNATTAHWVALSTHFARDLGLRNRVVMTDQDFPSSIYAVSEIAKFLGWEIDMVQSRGRYGIEVDRILDRIDDRTLFVATSHVYFKSGYIQDISRIADLAQRVGALTLIDGYHAPGTIPVNLKDLGVDFYIGGCLKWLCGGPGNAFLFVKKDLRTRLKPRLTGWFAHRSPFSFSPDMEFTEGEYRFMSGTPPIPSLYTVSAGLNIIKRIGILPIRAKSRKQTRLVINGAIERGFSVYSPEEDDLRGGAVSLVIPHGYQVKQALQEQGILVDFRQGIHREPDIIRIGPHFYSEDEEIGQLFKAIDEIYAKGMYKKFDKKISTVT
jgi:kynureninase